MKLAIAKILCKLLAKMNMSAFTLCDIDFKNREFTTKGEYVIFQKCKMIDMPKEWDKYKKAL